MYSIDRWNKYIFPFVFFFSFVALVLFRRKENHENEYRMQDNDSGFKDFLLVRMFRFKAGTLDR